MKYAVLGANPNPKEPYCETLLAEVSTHMEALRIAKTQRGAWDRLIIRVDDNPDKDEYILTT